MPQFECGGVECIPHLILCVYAIPLVYTCYGKSTVCNPGFVLRSIFENEVVTITADLGDNGLIACKVIMPVHCEP